MSLVAGALLSAGACAAASPYLARLTVTVPDRDNARWWAGARPGHRRLAVTAGVAAALGALAGAAAGVTALLPAFVALALVGAALAVIDFEHHRLPNRLVFALAGAAAALLAVAAAVQGRWPAAVRAGEAAAAVFAVLFVLCLAAPRGFGYGDVKLAGVLGGYLGWFGWSFVYYGIFAGFVLGALLAFVLLAARRATMKTAMPFGPMLITGALLVLAFDLVPAGM